MKTKEVNSSRTEELRVLVVGNNPIELGRVFDSLHEIPGKRIVTEIAFDLRSLVERLAGFTPNFILIDDNVGTVELRNSVQVLLRYRRTRRIPITILKNSNYHEAISAGVFDFVLKANLTGELLYSALKNSIKFGRTQKFLQRAYKRRKGQFARLLG